MTNVIRMTNMTRHSVFGLGTFAVLACTLSLASTAAGGARGVTDARFSGNGGKTLAPFTVSADSTLSWTNDGDVFQLFNAALTNSGTVNSTARRGTTYLPRGRYSLQVNAIGNWTITIRRGAERPLRLGGGAIGFRGNGGKALPPVGVAKGSTLSWSNSGEIFQLFNESLSTDGTVNSQAGRGTTYLPKGTYKLYVNALGNWTITIR